MQTLNHVNKNGETTIIVRSTAQSSMTSFLYNSIHFHSLLNETAETFETMINGETTIIVSLLILLDS